MFVQSFGHPRIVGTEVAMEVLNVWNCSRVEEVICSTEMLARYAVTAEIAHHEVGISICPQILLSAEPRPAHAPHIS